MILEQFVVDLSQPVVSVFIGVKVSIARLLQLYERHRSRRVSFLNSENTHTCSVLSARCPLVPITAHLEVVSPK